MVWLRLGTKNSISEIIMFLKYLAGKCLDAL